MRGNDKAPWGTPARKPFRVMAGVLGALMLLTAVLLAFIHREPFTILLLLSCGLGFIGVAASGFWLVFRPPPRQ